MVRSTPVLAKSMEPKLPEFEPPSRNQGQASEPPRREYTLSSDKAEYPRGEGLGVAKSGRYDKCRDVQECVDGGNVEFTL